MTRKPLAGTALWRHIVAVRVVTGDGASAVGAGGTDVVMGSETPQIAASGRPPGAGDGVGAGVHDLKPVTSVHHQLHAGVDAFVARHVGERLVGHTAVAGAARETRAVLALVVDRAEQPILTSSAVDLGVRSALPCVAGVDGALLAGGRAIGILGALGQGLTPLAFHALVADAA